MKKVIALIFLIWILSSCWNNKEIIDVEKIDEIVKNEFVVWWKESNYLNIYGNVLNNNL